MIDLIDQRTLLIVGCTTLVLAGVIGALATVVLARREEARRPKLVAVSEVSRDWQPTWRINAVTDAWVMENEKDDIPANFVLRLEEDRKVRDIGGGDVTEIRWRAPTKAEMREIVHRYHEARNGAKPIDVIEFQRQLHAGASSEFYADRDGGLHRRGDASAGATAATLVPASDQLALGRHQPLQEKQSAAVAAGGRRGG